MTMVMNSVKILNRKEICYNNIVPEDVSISVQVSDLNPIKYFPGHIKFTEWSDSEFRDLDYADYIHL